MRKRDTPHYWVYRIRGFVMAPLLAVMLFCTWREVEFDAAVFPIGGAIFLLGLGVRIWAQMHLHYRLSVRKHLTTTGPYHYLRNPIYVGNMLILAGLCVTSEVLWFLPAVLLYGFAVYSMVVRHEEAHLTQKYGDAYRDFMAAVPRWIPSTLLPASTNTSVGRFFLPSVRVELYNFLFLAVPLLKEFIIDR
jgi:protein-S-isoprenylcysteine O-methyltransferase Ste14